MWEKMELVKSKYINVSSHNKNDWSLIEVLKTFQNIFWEIPINSIIIGKKLEFERKGVFATTKRLCKRRIGLFWTVQKLWKKKDAGNSLINKRESTAPEAVS